MPNVSAILIVFFPLIFFFPKEMNNCLIRPRWMSLSNFFIIKQELGNEPKCLLCTEHNVLATPPVKVSYQGLYQVYHDVYSLLRISFSAGLFPTHFPGNTKKSGQRTTDTPGQNQGIKLKYQEFNKKVKTMSEPKDIKQKSKLKRLEGTWNVKR